MKEEAKGSPLIADATRAAWATQAGANPPDPISWIRFIDDLRIAAELDGLGVVDKPGKTPGLQSAFNALHAVLVFLGKQQSSTAPDLKPLTRLHNAIIDLKKKERIDPLFKATLGTGSPGNGTNYEIAKGTAARAMSLLMQAGNPPEKARKMVADALSDTTFGTKVSGPTISGVALPFDGGRRCQRGNKGRLAGLFPSSTTRIWRNSKGAGRKSSQGSARESLKSSDNS